MRAEDILLAYGIQHAETSANEIRKVALQLVGHSEMFVSGVGKSELVARKFVGTCQSLRYPAHFLSALNALHGDMGITWGGDVLVLVSASGETRELIELAEEGQARDMEILVVTKYASNPLAQLADHRLFTTSPNVDPGHIPTASFISAVAVLDALAVELTGPKAQLYHPGGSIGRQLS